MDMLITKTVKHRGRSTKWHLPLSHFQVLYSWSISLCNICKSKFLRVKTQVTWESYDELCENTTNENRRAKSAAAAEEKLLLLLSLQHHGQWQLEGRAPCSERDVYIHCQGDSRNIMFLQYRRRQFPDQSLRTALLGPPFLENSAMKFFFSYYIQILLLYKYSVVSSICLFGSFALTINIV